MDISESDHVAIIQSARGQQALTSESTSKEVVLADGVRVLKAAFLAHSEGRFQVFISITNTNAHSVTIDASGWSIMTSEGTAGALAPEGASKLRTLRLEPNSEWRSSILFAADAEPRALRFDAVKSMKLAKRSTTYPSTSVEAR